MQNNSNTPGDVQNVKLNPVGKHHNKHRRGHGGTKELVKKDGFKNSCPGKFLNKNKD